MEPMLSSKSSPIVIVGAGVFGLSTAIHLAERGYTNVKVLDRQAYHQTQYRYKNGCDSASAGYGTLDVQSGFVYADKACHFARHKAECLGVKFDLGSLRGAFSGFLEDVNGHITGVKTADGASHTSELTIMACGGWTPGLLPQLDHLCETTAGSVFMFQLPPDEALWNKFAPGNFPTWSFDIRRGRYGGLYGFARDPDGVVKIGYRGTKFTNPQVQPDGTVRSVAVTRWTQHAIHSVPEIASRTIQKFVREQLPELLDCATTTRLCWYTDSYDNHFVIDFVPQKRGLMVATGGSGHGFKFLPNLGEHVVDRIEGKTNGFLEDWKWRARDAGVKPYNSIMEGVESDRSLWRQPLVNLNCAAKQHSRL
ncbi:hypothetical protein MY10362_009413 [Beauveria mimosiformis]